MTRSRVVWSHAIKLCVGTHLYLLTFISALSPNWYLHRHATFAYALEPYSRVDYIMLLYIYVCSSSDTGRTSIFFYDSLTNSHVLLYVRAKNPASDFNVPST